eukprot:Gb_11365 [translate_table: standard]
METLTISLSLTLRIFWGLGTSTTSDGSMIWVPEVQMRWMFVVPTILTSPHKRVMCMSYDEVFVLLIPTCGAFFPMRAYQIGSTVQSLFHRCTLSLDTRISRRSEHLRLHQPGIHDKRNCSIPKTHLHQA